MCNQPSIPILGNLELEHADLWRHDVSCCQSKCQHYGSQNEPFLWTLIELNRSLSRIGFKFFPLLSDITNRVNLFDILYLDFYYSWNVLAANWLCVDDSVNFFFLPRFSFIFFLLELAFLFSELSNFCVITLTLYFKVWIFLIFKVINYTCL